MEFTFVVILLLGSCVCLVQPLGGSGSFNNNYTYGAKATGDTLIAREIVSREKLLLQTVTRTYTLSQAGTAKTISFIQITDLKPKSGATAEITDGGVGGTTLTITFTSRRSHGIRFQVEVWGQ